MSTSDEMSGDKSKQPLPDSPTSVWAALDDATDKIIEDALNLPSALLEPAPWTGRRSGRRPSAASVTHLYGMLVAYLLVRGAIALPQASLATIMYIAMITYVVAVGLLLFGPALLFLADMLCTCQLATEVAPSLLERIDWMVMNKTARGRLASRRPLLCMASITDAGGAAYDVDWGDF